MCVVLANLSYAQTDLNSIEKHILLILCLRADPKTKLFWCGINRIKEDSGYSINTVEKTMKSLRDKNKIIQTGKKKGAKKLTPEYKINIFNTPTTWGDSTLITPSQNLIPPSDGGLNTPTSWGTERYIERSIRKGEFLNSQGPTAIKNLFEKLGAKK